MAIEKSSSTIKIFNIFLYFTPLSLTSRGLLVHLLPNNAFPFFADFSPPKTISIRREERDRRHEVRRHLRHAIFSMDETFDAIILKARRERIHSGRLLHGTMAAVGFKTGGLGNEGGGTCRFSLLNAWELSRSARNS